MVIDYFVLGTCKVDIGNPAGYRIIDASEKALDVLRRVPPQDKREPWYAPLRDGRLGFYLPYLSITPHLERTNGWYAPPSVGRALLSLGDPVSLISKRLLIPQGRGYTQPVKASILGKAKSARQVNDPSPDFGYVRCKLEGYDRHDPRKRTRCTKPFDLPCYFVGDRWMEYPDVVIGIWGLLSFAPLYDIAAPPRLGTPVGPNFGFRSFGPCFDTTRDAAQSEADWYLNSVAENRLE